MEEDIYFMRECIAQAQKATEAGDVPIGCVIVKDGEIIAKAHNVREKNKKATGHAEIEAIEQASQKLGRWRLSDCTLYVTLEPCCMCAGAIINSRISRVVFALKDAKSGAFGSVVNLNFYPLGHRPKIQSGVLEEEAEQMMKKFFQELRNNKKGK